MDEVYRLIDNIFVDNNWRVIIDEGDNLFILDDLFPQMYYIRKFSKSIYFPFIKEGIEITIESVARNNWSIYSG